MADDLFTDRGDTYEIDPPDLGATVQRVLELSLAKRLSDQLHNPWTQETELQEVISKLIAAAHSRGLRTVRLTVTHKTGQKVSRDLDIEKIGKDRVLQ
jgi:hypothetical protein